MSKGIDAIPFNLDKYVNYELDGYEFVDHEVFDIWRRCTPKREVGARIWSKVVNGIDYQIRELDIISTVDYLVNFYGKDGVCRIASHQLEHVGEISWKIVESENVWQYHRNDGPAIIRINKNQKVWKAEWWVRGVDISHEVRPWIKSMGLPVFYKWTYENKILFKLAFG